jgi:hypothetical protein
MKGKPGEPTLISWDDANTLFHEFGHALHGLQSNVNYPSLAGTSVKRDFVEFPSQVNERWLLTREVLSKFALHCKTGKPIPEELIAKIEKAKTFNQGFSTTEYLASAIYDMKIHLAATPDKTIEPDEFEKVTMTEIGCPKEMVTSSRMTDMPPATIPTFGQTPCLPMHRKRSSRLEASTTERHATASETPYSVSETRWHQMSHFAISAVAMLIPMR